MGSLEPFFGSGAVVVCLMFKKAHRKAFSRPRPMIRISTGVTTASYALE